MKYPAAVLWWGKQRIPIADLDITFHEDPPPSPDDPPDTVYALTSTNEGSSVEESGKGSTTR